MKKWTAAKYNGSRKYNSDYAYNDEWVHCNWKWRILSDRKINGTESYGHTMRIKTSSKVSDKILYRVLSDYFVQGCSCEFDCCGHWFGGVVEVEKPTNRKTNEHIVTTGYSPNY